MEMTMGKIKREELLSLEAYYKARPEMRLKAIAERKKRTVILGEHLNMIFENKYLMQYQIQEMLRVEKIFEDEGIQEEILSGLHRRARPRMQTPNRRRACDRSP